MHHTPPLLVMMNLSAPASTRIRAPEGGTGRHSKTMPALKALGAVPDLPALETDDNDETLAP